jgi:hypothetical protein
MQASLSMTLFIVFMCLLVMISLFKGLGAILDKSKPGRNTEQDLNKTAKALTFRITLSLLLFFSIISAYFAGLIQPHGLSLQTSDSVENLSSDKSPTKTTE